MIKIITDSVASIPQELAREANVDVLSLYVNRDGREYEDATMDLDEFYQDIYSLLDHIPTSSQPSQHLMERLFEEAAEAGHQVLGVFLSSKMSGTFESAVRCARAVKARRLDFSCELVNSTSAGYDQAFPVFEAVRARDAGKSLKECCHAVTEAIGCSRFLFTPESLTFLQKGGRIGGAAALLGNLVKIAPVLTVRDGEATTFAKVRTRKKALERIMSAFGEDVSRHGMKDVVVQYIGDRKPAAEWARSVVEPFVGRAVQVLPVSPVLGVHVGPAMGIAYECERPVQGKIDGMRPTVFSLA